MEDGQILSSCDPGKPLGQEGACDEADSLPDLDVLLTAVRATASNRYAGSYLDRTSSPVKQVIMFTSMTGSDQALLDAASGHDPRVIARPATFTRAQLQSAQSRLLAALATLPGQFQVGEDTQGNQLQAIVGTTAMRDLISKTLGDIALPPAIVSVKVDPDLGVSRLTNRTVYPPHAGGLALVLDDLDTTRVDKCTSGFSIKSTGGTQMGVTAGHCSRGYLQAGITIGADYLSRSGMNSYWASSPANSDALRYTVPSSASWSPKILVGEGSYRWVTSPRYTMDTLQEGTSLCFQGVVSDNNNCGTIQRGAVNVGIIDEEDNRITYHTFGINYAAQSGDSGGPVYHVNTDGSAKPAGIVAAGANGRMYFSQIGYLLDDMDASLAYH